MQSLRVRGESLPAALLVCPHQLTPPTYPVRLHFLFPLTAFSPLACKSLLSALVLGYEPVLLNWGAKETGGKARQIKVRRLRRLAASSSSRRLADRSRLPPGLPRPRRRPQVQGVRNYLANNVTDPNDLVFMVDAFGACPGPSCWPFTRRPRGS